MFEQLVKKAKKGDKDAFSELIKNYQNTLYVIAKSRLNQEDDVYDAVQETIISAYQSINKLNNASSFKYWIIKILINKCNSIYREKNKHNNISIDELEYKCYSENEILYSNIEFENLLKSLNPDEKTILILYYAEKYRTKEISKILDINENTVRSKISRAKKKLEDNLKEVL